MTEENKKGRTPGVTLAPIRKGCAKKVLREKVDKKELASMTKLVEANYGPEGSYELKGLDTGYNPQNNVIRSREWNRVIGVMAEAKKGRVDNVGHTWDSLGEDLLALLKRVQRNAPEAIPDFAVKDCRSACYFALAIVQFRKKKSRRDD